MARSRQISIEIIADAKQLERVFKQTGQAATGLNAKLSGAGLGLTKTLTPVAGAVALASRQAFKEWDTGIDMIRAGTGATGDQLKQLGDVMKTVGGQVTQPLSEIGVTVADLNTRLGLTGKPLERMTKQFADLDRLGMAASVGEVSRVFGDWSVKTGEQADALDGLFRASQLTGQTIDGLSAGLVRFGAPLRQFGFSMEQAAALLGKFEKEGVNTELVTGSMRIALGKLAKQGKDPPKAFAEIVKQIRATGSVAKANQLAIATFGARAGPDMAAAIREGRFEIGKLFAQMEGGTDTISKAAKDTLDLGDRMTMLKNRVFAATGPYGEFIAIAAGGAAALGPMLFGLAQLAPALAAARKAMLALNLAMLANPAVLIAAGVIALGAAIVIAWKRSETFRKVVTGAFDGVKAAAEAVFGFFRTHWKTIGVLISGPFAPIVALATDAFGVRSALVGAFRGLREAVRKAAATVGRAITEGVLDGVKGLPGALKGALESGLKGALGKLNPFSPVSHGGRRFIGEEIIRGAIEGIERSVPAMRTALDVGLRNALAGQKARGLQLGPVDMGIRTALADKLRLNLDMGIRNAAMPAPRLQPALAAAGGGAFVVQHQTVLDGRVLERSTTRYQQQRSRANPPQKRGPHAGL